MQMNLLAITLSAALAIYLVIANLYGLIIMYQDKQKSKKKQWRVPEGRLFIIALLFGSVGIWAGMYLFRHKTRHWKFVIGVPVIIIAQFYLLFRLGIKFL